MKTTIDPDARTPTILTVTGYMNGEPYVLEAQELECGHILAKELVTAAREALRVAREDGVVISINSAFRTMERQTELHEAHKRDPKHFAPADRPGYSRHQQGVALDLHFIGGSAERERFAAMMIAHGWFRPHEAEPWHFELTPLKEGTS